MGALLSHCLWFKYRAFTKECEWETVCVFAALSSHIKMCEVVFRLRDQTYGYRGCVGWEDIIVREFGVNMCTLLFLTWITNKVLLYSIWNSAECYMAGGFPGGSVGKESACSAGDLGSIPGSGRSPGAGNGNPVQYDCLRNPMDRRAWQAPVHEIMSWRDWSDLAQHAWERSLGGIGYMYM